MKNLFLTVRTVACRLKCPDGSDGQIIIDYSAKPYSTHMEVFETQGVSLPEAGKNRDFVILDESAALKCCPMPSRKR